MKKLFISLFVVVAMTLPNIALSQQQTLKMQANPELKVSGTSTLHDWEMPSKQASGTMVAIITEGKITEIKSLVVDMPAESIKSGKKGMDKIAYEAMKTDKYKTVKFVLESAVKNGNKWKITGKFTIAGTTKQAKFEVEEKALQFGVHSIAGVYSLKLTDYGITPPTAMMGTIKTGDAVKISFNVKFK